MEFLSHGIPKIAADTGWLPISSSAVQYGRGMTTCLHVLSNQAP